MAGERDDRSAAILSSSDSCADAGRLAWAFVPLAPERRLYETGFDPLPDIGEQLRLFVDGYGLVDRSAVIPALTRGMAGAAGGIRDWGLGPTDSAVALEFVANELRWLGRHLGQLERAMR